LNRVSGNSKKETQQRLGSVVLGTIRDSRLSVTRIESMAYGLLVLTMDTRCEELFFEVLQPPKSRGELAPGGGGLVKQNRAACV
jgi:hypothetical protein